ncbi:hypothetical protein ACFX14_011259 [Malus domestica]
MGVKHTAQANRPNRCPRSLAFFRHIELTSSLNQLNQVYALNLAHQGPKYPSWEVFAHITFEILESYWPKLLLGADLRIGPKLPEGSWPYCSIHH